MATQAQITANQLNALKSRGPVTAQGKQAVRFNALKTGIDATQIIIPGEGPEEFEAFERTEKLLGRLQTQVASIERSMSQATRDLERLQAARVKAAARLPKPPAPVTEQSQFSPEQKQEILDRWAKRAAEIDDSAFDF